MDPSDSGPSGPKIAAPTPANKQPWARPFNHFQEEWPEMRKVKWSFALCGFVLLVIGAWSTYLLLKNVIIDGKDATIEHIKEERDSALRERNESRAENAPLKSQIEQLAKENFALKNTGAYVPETFHFQSGEIRGFPQSPGRNIRGLIYFSISNGLPRQPVTLDLKITPETARFGSLDAVGNDYPSLISGPDGQIVSMKCFPDNPKRLVLEFLLTEPAIIRFSGDNFDHELKLKITATNIVVLKN
jgi:hypothetical protein